jgi:hypothetical protein
MKDLIDHMTQCHAQLEWAADGRTESFLTNTMIGDLAECRRLCEELRLDRGKAHAMTAL